MKKEIAIPIIIVIVLVIVVLAVYGITGKLTSGEPTGCVDTDVTGDYPDGINYYEKGQATYDNRDKVYEDYCTDDKWIREYYCHAPYTIKAKKKLCENGCSDGACIE